MGRHHLSRLALSKADMKASEPSIKAAIKEACSTVSRGQITFLGRVILLCPNYLHMDVNGGGDLSPSISRR